MVKVERQGSAKAERDEAKARKKSHIQKDDINLNLIYFIYWPMVSALVIRVYDNLKNILK